MTDDNPRTFTAPGVAAAGDPSAPPAAGELNSPLDDLRAELAAELEHFETFEVSTRPGYAVRFDVDIEHEKLGLWRKRAKDKSQPDGLDELLWASIIVASQAVAILRNGVPVFEADAGVSPFAGAELLGIYGVGRPVDAVQRFYGRDSQVINTCWAVLSAAGYGEEAKKADDDDAADPTRSSSRSS